MPPSNYVRPPITEAVIELRFGEAASEENLAKFARAVDRVYPNSETGFQVTVRVETSKDGRAPQVTPDQKFDGYKLTGQDASDVILVKTTAISTVRLAPYQGWDQLIEKTKNNYASLKKVVGYRNLSRIATRYINRIDIPKQDRESIRTEDYVLLEPRVPETVKLLNSFTVQFVGPVKDSDVQAIVNAGTVASPLIDHYSLLLDIDLFKEQNISQKEADLWQYLTELRDLKDKIFESFITDQARELFDRA